MRTQFATALLALAVPLHAVQITSPSKNDVVDPSEGVEVKWSTVSTDPARAKLILVNKISGHSPFTKDLGEVDLSAGSITITEKDVPSDGGYQFNFESVDKSNTGILAQSEQFEVTESEKTDDEDDNESSSTSAATTAATTSSVVRTATLTSTATFSDSTVTMTTTALTTDSTAPATTKGTDNDDDNNNDDDDDSTVSENLNGAAPMAVQLGSLFALVAGVAAFMA
jgi:hypothetical protein